jgi:mycothiol synthase
MGAGGEVTPPRESQAANPEGPVAQTQVLSHLTAEHIAAINALVAAAEHADGVSPLSEHVLLHLQGAGVTDTSGDPGAHHLLHRLPGNSNGTADGAGGPLVGYAYLDTGDAVQGSSTELVVHPAHRGTGHGRALVAAVIEAAPDHQPRLWAHGAHPAAAGLAASMGFRRVRALWQLRAPLTDLPAPEFPYDVNVRTFVVGQDEREWVALNAQAFAVHPEQGAWSLADLHARMAEPWFDPAGFFLAERAGRLVGFHWTKVHGAAAQGGQEHPHPPIGEVYVVGVDPDAQGGGLGKALTLVGLHHLRERGLDRAMLYVEEDNAAAIRVYTSLGFTHWDTDVVYQRKQDE